MKRTIILLIALTLSTFVMAQEKTKVKELGLTFRNLDGFGFSYKVGTEQSLWRFNALSFSGGSGDYEEGDYNKDNKSFGFSFNVGKEYRKLIAKNMEFRYGADLSFGYSYDKGSSMSGSEGKSNNYYPGINMVLGVNYIINDHIILGAEIMPSIGYSFRKSTDNDGEKTTNKNNHFSYGFDSSSVLLSLAYRF
ncbi:hypothetical protein [Ancylomarina sp.]|uniref:hypothetical protein n=1 Tax=Ancylomarina sp. TaxID=1970196 RepID=UPI003568AC00